MSDDFMEDVDPWLDKHHNEKPLPECPSCRDVMVASKGCWVSGCGAVWSRTSMSSIRLPISVPKGYLYVRDEQYLNRNDASVWGGKAVRKGGVIEF